MKLLAVTILLMFLGISVFGQTNTITAKSINATQSLKLRNKPIDSLITVNISSFGAVGDGTTDNLTPFLNAAASGKRVLIPAGTYFISGRINFSSVNGTSFIGDNKGTTVITSNTAKELVFLYGSNNIRIENISFINNYPTEVTAQINCISSVTDSVFDGIHFSPLDSGLYIHNCYFKCPKGDGIVMVSNRGGGANGYKRDIYVTNCVFENIGATAFTCLCGTALGMSNIHFEGNVTRHTGLMDDAPGMALSLSGNLINGYCIGNQAHDYKTIGYEFAGPSYSILQDNTGDSSHRSQGAISTCLFTFDATGATTSVGNKAIHNTSLDNAPSFPHINNQDQLTLQDNTLIADTIQMLFDSVRNLRISGDRYTRLTSNTNPIFYMRNGSKNVDISTTSFTGNSSLNQLILFQNRVTHVTFSNCYASGNAVNGTLINLDGTCTDISGTFNSVLAGSTNFDFGTTLTTTPIYSQVIDASLIRGKAPYGGFRNLTNTQRDALTPVEGLFIYSLTDHTLEFYNGTVWKQVTTN